MIKWVSMMHADRAHALAERLHAAESQLQQLAEAGGTPVVVFPARYPAATSPYRNIFHEDSTAAQPAVRAASDRPCSPAGNASPAAAEPAGEGASDMLVDASEALIAATAGLQRLAADMAAASAAGAAGAADAATGRVPGRDTVELFHFFNQLLPTEPQLRQEVDALQPPHCQLLTVACCALWADADGFSAPVVHSSAAAHTRVAHAHDCRHHRASCRRVGQHQLLRC